MTMQDFFMGQILPEVGNLQRFLNEKGFKGSDGKPLSPDEDFGGKTKFAVAAYQVSEKLPITGTFEPLTRNRATSEGFIPFILAQNFNRILPGAVQRQISLIVIHDMEAPDKQDTAQNCALFFKNQTLQGTPINGKPFEGGSSAHYMVDAVSVFQGVRDVDVAWHAPNANHNGIGIEHAGYARETAADWASDYNEAMLKISAKLVAKLCRMYSIPTIKLSVADLKGGKSGICGHVDVTNALCGGSGHQDPGVSFPYTHYLDLISQF
jgi:N-acetyl-anhydromuramyl-L-alanine amidase AmpD